MRYAVDRQRRVAFRITVVEQDVDRQGDTQGCSGVVDHRWRLVRGDVDGHRGHLRLQPFVVLGSVGESGGHRPVDHWWWGIEHGSTAAEGNAAQASVRLGKVGDAQRHVVVRVAVIAQQVQGQRHAEAGAALIRNGHRRLVLGFDRRIADDHHRFGITATGGGFDRDTGRRLCQAIDRQALHGAGLGQAAIALGDQVGHLYFVAGAGLDQQAFVGPVVTRSGDLDHIAELARQRGGAGSPARVGGGDHDHRWWRARAQAVSEEQAVVVRQQVELARRSRGAGDQCQGFAKAQGGVVRCLGKHLYPGTV
ncbi:hypothetical protein D3C76_980960 [compost metagenome]